MDNSPKGLRRSISALEDEIHKLLRDAPWKQDIKAVSDQWNTQYKHHKVDAPSPILTDGAPPAPKENKPKQHWYNSVDWWTARPFKWWKVRVEVIALFAGIGYAVITYHQWRDLRHNFEIDQRAWIKVSYSFPSNITEDTDAMVNIIPTNIGKSPAGRIEISAAAEITDRMSDPSFILMPPAPANSGMVFPNDKDNFPVFFRNPASQNPLKPRKFTSSEIVKLMSGQSYLCVFGFALYADQFNRHWTRFCGWVVYHDGAYNTKGCARRNTTGEGFPTPLPQKLMKK